MKREGNAIVLNFFFYRKIANDLSHNALTVRKSYKIRDNHNSLLESSISLRIKKEECLNSFGHGFIRINKNIHLSHKISINST